MIAPKHFIPFMTGYNKNFVDEIHLLIVMKRLNLYADVSQRSSSYVTGPLLNNYDYDSILTAGLKNKCQSNIKLYNSSSNSTVSNSLDSNSTSIYTQQLNSTLVDPNNIQTNSTRSPDDIKLDKSQLNGAGMDKSY
jgi:hypothetical protein